MMNKILILFIFFQTFNNNESLVILEKVNSKILNYENISIDFTLNFKNQKIQEEQSGSIIISENKFRLEINDQLIINDGKTQWIYLKSVNELQIINNESYNGSFNLSDLLDFSNEKYKSKYIDEVYESNNKTKIIELYPKKEESFMKIELKLKSKNLDITNIKIFDKNGGSYSYKINSFNTNTKIPPFNFNTKEYPNIEIIDLR